MLVSAPDSFGEIPGLALPEDDRLRSVLGSLEQLDELEVNLHVSVFEQAHDELRNALSPQIADSD